MTAVSPVKAAATVVSEPAKGLWNGMKYGWNYPEKPKYYEPKGWRTPFQWAGNAMKWGWHKAKALPTAVTLGVSGLGLGLVKGVTDGVVHDIGGVKWTMPAPEFMAGGAPAHAAEHAAPAAAAHKEEHHEAKHAA